MEPFYKYYIIQLQTAYVANDYCEKELTDDKEQAYAFVSREEAEQSARQYEGRVVECQVSEQELVQLGDEDFYEELDLSVFCQQRVAF